ncbi:MAG: gamma-glutamyl-gamma-aminobutyrate hydrolase family protein [Gammaproteobacteria bacterium]|nr:gamma-glutamyl-gamma-aminobutyrate hydrolase family protein [Gammaproteobacteria bacterium]
MRAFVQPLVGLPADTHEAGGFLYHSIGDKYVRAVAEEAHCVPVMLPALTPVVDLDHALDHLDGVVMTGSPSNVHPPRYGEPPTTDHEPYDLHRDDLTLKLIERCVARAIPLLCICRGFQELNVAFGGSLETELQRGEGRLDHRAPRGQPLAVRYGPAHAVAITPGGWLETLLETPEILVNSIHRQGIRRLAPALQVEATAPDGVIEAVTLRDAPGFVFGVQWHPEYRAWENPYSRKIFAAFGTAVRAYREQRRVAPSAGG